MANRFWVGGTGTWDNSATTNWAATSGGASGASAPVNGDNVTFDGSSGGGVVTVASSVSGLSLVNLTAGAFTGTLDFSVNNPNMTVTGAMTLSGTGTRKFLLGSGTFTFSITSNTTFFDLSTTTNLDGTSVLTAPFVVSGATAFDRSFAGGGRTYGSLTVNSNTSGGQFIFSGANTFSSISLAAGLWVNFPAGTTTTISNAPTITGTSASPIMIRTGSPNSGVATLSVASGTVSFTWAGLYGITGTGGATFSATNSFNFGRNTGVTITAPSSGGVVGVIGG